MNRNEEEILLREDDEHMRMFRRRKGVLLLVAYVALMSVSFGLLKAMPTASHQGVMAQAQVILTILLVVVLPRYGYVTGMLVMGIQTLAILARLLGEGDWTVLPGVLVGASTLVSITLINVFWGRFTRKHLELLRSKDELSLLNQEIAQASQKALHLANHDPVTGLINSACLRTLLDDFHAGRGEEAPRDALVLLELENFQLINSIVGQKNGELILQEIAGRIQAQALLHPAVAARLDGSCFALFAPFPPDGVESSIRALQQAVHAPLTVNDEVLEIRTCAGYAMASGDAVDTESLLRCADLALSAAREERRSSVKSYDSAMARKAHRRIAIVNELEMALERNEFEMRYQPQVDASNGLVVGAEALVRWKNGRLGSMSPAEFIPLAEQNGQIVPVGNWILERACRDAMQWPDGWKVAVNVSAGQFINRDFEEEVERAREAAGLRAGRLKLEVTESVLIGGELKVGEILRRMRARHMSVALDDFGTGYSSLSYLTSLPLDELKIDRSFVTAMRSDPKTLAIVETILRLARLLDLSTTAEGVETTEQADLLRDMGCGRFQGYLYGQPLTQAELLLRYAA